VSADPCEELLPADSACGDTEYYSFLFVYVGAQFVTVEDEKSFHRSVSHSFVTVDEWVVHDQRKSESGSFLSKCVIKVDTSKAHRWLRDGGFEHPRIAYSGRSTRFLLDKLVQFNHFLESEVTH
jgi:hypothetical protein